jgi:hypothetical protein
MAAAKRNYINFKIKKQDALVYETQMSGTLQAPFKPKLTPHGIDDILGEKKSAQQPIPIYVEQSDEEMAISRLYVARKHLNIVLLPLSMMPNELELTPCDFFTLKRKVTVLALRKAKISIQNVADLSRDFSLKLNP